MRLRVFSAYSCLPDWALVFVSVLFIGKKMGNIYQEITPQNDGVISPTEASNVLWNPPTVPLPPGTTQTSMQRDPHLFSNLVCFCPGVTFGGHQLGSRFCGHWSHLYRIVVIAEAILDNGPFQSPPHTPRLICRLDDSPKRYIARTRRAVLCR